MSAAYTLFAILALASYGFWLGRGSATKLRTAGARLHSLPDYYGWLVAMFCGVPALLVFVAWLVLEPKIAETLVLQSLPEAARAQSDAMVSLALVDIRNLATGGVVSRVPEPWVVAAAAQYKNFRDIAHTALFVIGALLCLGGLAYGWRQVKPDTRARNRVERGVMIAMVVCSTIAILTTLGIVLSLLFESLRFFSAYSPIDFLFGLQWSPQTAIRADQVGATGAFGFVPLLTGTMLITVIAMSVAVPVGLFAAIYMADYASHATRAWAKPALEVLAGVPTVVFGFFAALTVAPLVRDLGPLLGLEIASESALAAGLVMGVMIVPFVSSLCDDVIHAVPQSLRHGAYGLGATKSETIRQVVLPAALPGIVAAVMLAISKAIGETMIVAMAAGLAANLTFNPFEAVTTVTVQIATLLVGDQEFDSPKTLSAFALGLVLFCVTLSLNVVALRVVRKYREKYD